MLHLMLEKARGLYLILFLFLHIVWRSHSQPDLSVNSLRADLDHGSLCRPRYPPLEPSSGRLRRNCFMKGRRAADLSSRRGKVDLLRAAGPYGRVGVDGV